VLEGNYEGNCHHPGEESKHNHSAWLRALAVFPKPKEQPNDRRYDSSK